MANTPIMAAPVKKRATQLNSTEGDSAKADTPTPSAISMISAHRPLFFTFPRPATASAPTTDPAPEVDRNHAATEAPR